ncbi:transglycosylase domain-containing protein [Salinithrix halophila]|uniref:Transglycosylase domain-containing protein n=1 Tax=Salinithrix halophila TaxID=1485204 RepID=A0ABV8JDN9_9BACL
MGVEAGKTGKKLAVWWAKGWVRKTVWTLTALFAVFFLTFNILIQIQDVSALDRAVPQPTLIYDREGRIASKISASKVEGLRLQEVPLHMIQAVISVEDQRFYRHSGVDYVGTTRAALSNLWAGGTVQGGSTLTQQLAKNVFLTHERTYKRKVKEVLLAKKIERTYSKDEIMEMYLNTVYFGEGAWGLKKAARTYFGKEVKDLTPGESAMLAGLIKAPSSLSPVKHFNRAMERQSIVLKLMKEQGFLSDEEVEKAKKENIVLEGQETDEYRGRYPSYVDAIIQEAIQRYGLTEKEVLNGGLRIYTELDPTMQRAAETVYRKDALFPDGGGERKVQSGSVLIDPKTGGLRALVGGRGEHVFRGFNHATQLKRQPGSSMKPLSVYAPAIASGYGIDTHLQDKPTQFNGGYAPKNYDGNYRGEVTMYEALIESKNVPAVWLLEQIGVEKGYRFAKAAGIPLTDEDHRLSLALGGLTEGTSPLAMAQAYSAFPNDGLMVDAHAIRKVENVDGEPVAHWYKKTTRLMKPKTAQHITYLLQGAVREGTGKNAAIPGRPTAGKTGTTQLPDSDRKGSKDHWFVGYTPELVGAVWIGYDKTDAQHFLTSSSGQTAARVFRQMMAGALAGKPVHNFNLSTVKWKTPPRVHREEKPKKEQKNLRKKLEKEWKKRKKHWEKQWKKQKKEWEKRWKKWGEG